MERFYPFSFNQLAILPVPIHRILKLSLLGQDSAEGSGRRRPEDHALGVARTSATSTTCRDGVEEGASYKMTSRPDRNTEDRVAERVTQAVAPDAPLSALVLLPMAG